MITLDATLSAAALFNGPQFYVSTELIKVFKKDLCKKQLAIWHCCITAVLQVAVFWRTVWKVVQYFLAVWSQSKDDDSVNTPASI